MPVGPLWPCKDAGGAEALMKHSCVQGVFSEESSACLSEGSRVTMQEPQARPWKSNSTSPA